MIPKTIHYCWFGGAPKSDLIQQCMASWKQQAPDYQVVEWSENNFDIQSHPFVAEAYEKKKWAFVSDYVRAHALHQQGGIYLDTDVELTQPLDSFLHHAAFSGFERKGSPFTALWAASAGHSWPQKVLDYYNGRKFSETTNTQIVSDLLINEYGADASRDEKQELKDGIVIYPSTHFCVEVPVNYAIHHFEGSWTRDNHSFKSELDSMYHLNAILDGGMSTRDVIRGLILIDKKNIYRILGSIKTKYLWRYLFGAGRS